MQDNFGVSNNFKTYDMPQAIDSQLKNEERNHFRTNIFFLVGLFVAFALIIEYGFVKVEQDEIAVCRSIGDTTCQVLSPGFHFAPAGITEITRYSAARSKVDVEAPVRFSDGNAAVIKATVSYTLKDPAEFVNRYGMSYTPDYVIKENYKRYFAITYAGIDSKGKNISGLNKLFSRDLPADIFIPYGVQLHQVSINELVVQEKTGIDILIEAENQARLMRLKEFNSVKSHKGNKHAR